jgi:hypothetical protein
MRPHAFVSRLTLASVLGVATLVVAQEGPPAGKREPPSGAAPGHR